MANGDYLSLVELRKLSKPINEITNDINSFAIEKKIDTLYHSRGWVRAKLTWINSNNLSCCIDLTMNDDKKTFELGISAYKYLEDKLYYKDMTILNNITTPFDVTFIISEMQKGFDKCNLWKLDDLTQVSYP